MTKFFLISFLATLPCVVNARNWKIDKTHNEVSFICTRLLISKTYNSFIAFKVCFASKKQDYTVAHPNSFFKNKIAAILYINPLQKLDSNKLIPLQILKLDSFPRKSKRHTFTTGASFGSFGYISTNDNSLNLQSTGTQNTISNLTFNLGPQAGFYITSDLVLGGNLNINLSRSNSRTRIQNPPYNATEQFNNFIINIGPYVRFYFANINVKNKIYGQVSTAFGSGAGNNKSNSISATSQVNSSGNTKNLFSINYGAGVGIVHSLQGRIALDFSLGYSHIFNKGTQYTNTTSVITDPQGVTSNNFNTYSSKSVSNSNGISASIGIMISQSW